MKIAGIVLAGGQSRRMGGNEKSLLSLGGRTLIEHAACGLSQEVGELAINANGDPARFAFLRKPVIADDVPGFAGPLAGILAGMNWAARSAATHVVTAAADTPFFPDDMVGRLSQSLTDGDSIAMAASDGRVHPVFGLWPVDLAADLRRFLVDEDKRKILEFANRYTLHEVAFATQPGGDPFFNINTRDDLAVAEERLAQGHD